MKGIKRTAALALALGMFSTTAFASAGVLENVEIESVAEYVQDGGIGTLKYDDPSMTVPEDIGAKKLPAKYDLRNVKGKSYVTSVKDQDNHSFCWAFATVASAESNLIREGIANNKIDLSEAHLAFFNFNGSNSYPLDKYAGKDSYIDNNNEFSNYLASSSTLLRGYGFVKESVIPYSETKPFDSFKSPKAAAFKKKYDKDSVRTKQQYQMNDMNLIIMGYNKKGVPDSKTMKGVKAMLKEKGAVATAIYSAVDNISDFEEGYGVEYGDYDKIENFYLNNDDTDHGVTVVGWDDNYPAEKFKVKPPADGAWLIKNSYGKVFGMDGYYWASYCNPSMIMFAQFDTDKKDNREMYQYNGTGMGDIVEKTTDKPISAANVFKARKDTLIDQVVVTTLGSDAKVNIKIAVEKNGKRPDKSTVLYNKTLRVKHVGAHTLDLGKKIGIAKGQHFSAAVKVAAAGDEGKEYQMPFEFRAVKNSDVKCHPIKKGTSFAGTGNVWEDLTKMDPIKDPESKKKYKLYSADIKAKGTKAGKKSQKINAVSKATIKKGKKLNLKAKITKGDGKLTYCTSDSKKATVTDKGVVKAKKKGTVKIKVTARPTAKCKSKVKTVKIKIK